MSAHVRCPACGAASLPPAASAQAQRCSSCGAAISYRVHWALYVAGAALLGALLGGVGALLVDDRVMRQLFIWPLFAVGLFFIGRYARRPVKA